MNIGQTVAFLALILLITGALCFLWKIWYLTFPHWKWREDPLGQRIKEHLSGAELEKIKRYRLWLLLSVTGFFILFALMSFLGEGPF